MAAAKVLAVPLLQNPAAVAVALRVSAEVAAQVASLVACRRLQAMQ